MCVANRHRLLYHTHTHKWVHMCLCVCVWGGGGKEALAFTPKTPIQVRTCVDWLLHYTHVHALSKTVLVHAMKGYWGVEVEIHLLLTWNWIGPVVSFMHWPLYSGESHPGTHQLGGWVGPAASLDTLRKL